MEFERDYSATTRWLIDDQERAGRTLDEVALEFLYRSDVIRVAVGERKWTDRVVRVGAEVMVLAIEGAEMDFDFIALSSQPDCRAFDVGGGGPWEASTLRSW